MYKLAQFFKSPLYENALSSYEWVANDLKWDIEDKLKLYNWAKKGFESNHTEEKRRQSFEEIYKELKKKWQVLRNAQGVYWTHSEIYDALTQKCSACSREKTYL